MSEAIGPVKKRTGWNTVNENIDGLRSARNGLLCALAVAACALAAYPVADMPFMDDFSYAKTALDFARTGHFLYNGWATAMLGWLVPWGALFIKAFGFSFTLLRASMLPIDMAAVYLFHQILRRFGINAGNAALGTLTLALSPLFLPMAASYMTDIPGLLVILVCISMCQRAVATLNDTNALLWLCFATIVNLAGGTVRQIAWLGALIMVPSTAWLLRDRRGMKMAGTLLWVFSFFTVLACLHWFNSQPYAVPEHIFAGPFHAKLLVHLAAQLVKIFLCLLLLILPVSIAWLAVTRRWTLNDKLRVAGGIATLGLLAIILNSAGMLDGWLMPWLVPVLAGQGISIPGVFGATSATIAIWMRLVVSLLVISPALILIEETIWRSGPKSPNGGNGRSSWSELIWILGPFSLGYLLLLVPRATFSITQDRYVLGLCPSAIIVLLRLYQERVSRKIPLAGIAVLALFAIYSIAGVHDFFSSSRALVKTIHMLQESGVPRNRIQAGMASDGWLQIQDGGHINDPRIKIPVGAYRRTSPDSAIPKTCRFWFNAYTPSIAPKYFVVSNPKTCFAPTSYARIHYTAWLPPFDRAVYVQKIRNGPG